jgi:hypothetical protein
VKNRTRFRIAAGSCVFTIAALTIAAVLHAAAGPLDGKAFVAETGEQGKKADAKDTIIFRDGTMQSTACDAYGFGPGTYTTMNHGTGTMFQAKTESPKEGAIQWNGMITGDSIDGTFVWTKPGQKPVTYWLKGTLKK